MTWEIVKIDSCGWYLTELDRLDSDLVKFLTNLTLSNLISFLGRRNIVELVDVVLLVWLVALCHNYLLDWARSNSNETFLSTFLELHEFEAIVSEDCGHLIGALANSIGDLANQWSHRLIAKGYSRRWVRWGVWENDNTFVHSMKHFYIRFIWIVQLCIRFFNVVE